jgi:ABC-type amino acid transport substrate-binding protein
LKKRTWLILGVFVSASLLAACTLGTTTPPTAQPVQETQASAATQPPAPVSPSATPTAAPVETATDEPGAEAQPTTAAQDDWSRIQAAGKLIVGTAAEYAPFTYFDNAGKLNGFDIALIRDLANRLGLSVEITDFAFEGLVDAVQIGQIDASIAAMSISPDRLALIDFTNLYYLGTDGVLARKSSNVKTITSPEQMAGYRVAVQRETVYEEWAQQYLVDPGIITSDQLFVYDKSENAVRDMRENRVDLVLLDDVPAQKYISNDVALVGAGLATQQFAIGVRKGSTLLAQLNRVLADARADGTIDRLAQEYLKVELPEVTQPTPTPAPTQTAPECVYAMQFVRDLNYDDENMDYPPELEPGERFEKGWRIRNSGSCEWNSSFYLSYARGNVPAAQMNGVPVAIPGTVEPGDTLDIYVDLIAPSYPGVYQGFWQMVSPNGKRFGQTIWVGIEVPGAEPTPSPDEPVIKSFSASPGNIQTGSCTTISWRVTGEVDQIELKRGNNQLWRDAPAKGTYQDCLKSAGTYTYRLTVNGPGGSTAQNIKVVVADPPPPTSPTIYGFLIKPREVGLGQCATIQWRTENADTVELYRNDELINRLGSEGDFQDCPDTPGDQEYRLVAKNRNGQTEATYSLLVFGGGITPR